MATLVLVDVGEDEQPTFVVDRLCQRLQRLDLQLLLPLTLRLGGEAARSVDGADAVDRRWVGLRREHGQQMNAARAELADTVELDARKDGDALPSPRLLGETAGVGRLHVISHADDRELGGQAVEILADAGGVIQQSGAVVSSGVGAGPLCPVEALRRVNVKRHRHESRRPIELLLEVGQQRVIGASHAASIASVTTSCSRRAWRSTSSTLSLRASRYGAPPTTRAGVVRRSRCCSPRRERCPLQ
jgi:hypothetical protein